MSTIPTKDVLAVKASIHHTGAELGLSRLSVKPSRPIYFVHEGNILARLVVDRQTGRVEIEARREISIIRENV